jgi:hypothetical protein
MADDLYKKMKKLIDNQAFLGATALVGFAMSYLTSFPFSAISGVIAVFSLLRLMRRREGQRNWAAIINSMADFEEIIGGQLWTGREAEILASDRVDSPSEPGPIRYEHICRTKQGAWFIFEVAVSMGRVVYRELRPCDEATAQYRLERHRTAYVRCFGAPKAA